ncbi:MAG: hypothetical protein SNJ29_16905 [Rikenellaceae bacterium]
MGSLSGTIRYVAKVLRSCSQDQFENSIDWAVAVVATKAKETPKLRADPRGVSKRRSIPPRVTVCQECNGTGEYLDNVCEQCGGSGRVVVSSEIETFVAAYNPNSN